MYISKPTFVLVSEKISFLLASFFSEARNKIHQSNPADQGVEILIYNREFYDWCVWFGKAKKKNNHIACACRAYKLSVIRNVG